MKSEKRCLIVLICISLIASDFENFSHLSLVFSVNCWFLSSHIFTLFVLFEWLLKLILGVLKHSRNQSIVGYVLPFYFVYGIVCSSNDLHFNIEHSPSFLFWFALFHLVWKISLSGCYKGIFVIFSSESLSFNFFYT